MFHETEHIRISQDVLQNIIVNNARKKTENVLQKYIANCFK